MSRNAGETLLSDHGDMRLVTSDIAENADEVRAADLLTGRNEMVQLDPDHPGFRDADYRVRRNSIARIAMEYRPGTQIPDAPYTAEEHELWRIIREAVDPEHRSHACVAYLKCIEKLDLPHDRIPQLGEVSQKVESISGFRLEPVAGLVRPRVFLESLADGVFLCTQYIRHYSTPLYTPEPDVVHELLGHAVTLASKRLAELNRMVGTVVKRTHSQEAFERLSRVYWFTIEFGVVREDQDLKAYGTGLLSSAGELQKMHSADLRPLDLEAASRQEYDPTKFQPILYCAASFDEMYQQLSDYLLRFK